MELSQNLLQILACVASEKKTHFPQKMELPQNLLQMNDFSYFFKYSKRFRIAPSFNKNSFFGPVFSANAICGVNL